MSDETRGRGSADAPPPARPIGMDRVRAAFQVRWTPEREAAGRRAMARATMRRTSRWPFLAGAVALAAGVCAAALSLTPASRARRPAPVIAAVSSLSFVDGSRVTMPAVTSIDVQEDGPAQALVTLRNGRARFEVVRNPARRFSVRAGGVEVEVLGTVFGVERLGERARVSVERGRVRVRWSGGEVELRSGDAGIFPPAAAARPPDAAGPPVPAAVAPAASDGAWRRLAHRGSYDRAYQALVKAGPAVVRDEAGDLLLAADVARLSNHPAEAVAPLERLLSRFPSDPRAAAAAFTLGRVLLDELERPAAAAVAFARAHQRGTGTLAEDALAREAEAWRRAGEGERAAAARAAYRARYPRGRHAGVHDAEAR